jgi:hypothetical protein
MSKSPQLVPQPEANPDLEPKLENEPISIAKPATAADPFSPANLRLSQAFADTVGVKKLLTTIPVRKPGAQEFVRVHPGPEYRDNFPLLELKDEREVYLVTAELAPELAGEVFGATLFTAINRQGTLFFWPVRLPSADGKDLEWWRSAREAADIAMGRWVRVKANINLGAYEIFEAASTMVEPQWPEQGYWDLLKIAFRDRLIDRVDHPVLKRLRGAA